MYFQTAQPVVHLVVFYHLNLELKTINSENSFHNCDKGIFIRLLWFKTADDFCLNVEYQAKIRIIFQLLMFFIDVHLVI